MRIFLLGGAALFIIALLYTGYRFLKPRRTFYLFAAIILLSTAVIVFFGSGQQNTTSQRQRTQILSEQPFFITWYENYKHSVEDIDHIWTKYNNIIEDFAEQKIGLAKMRQELLKNQSDMQQLRQKMENALPPQELSDDDYRLCYAVLEKTRSYLSVQNDTVNKTIQLVNTPDFQTKTFEEQQREINNIRILTAPVNLNIAGEVSAVRDNLRLPDL